MIYHYRKLLLLFSLLASSSLFSQFQYQWLYEKYYGYGTPFNCEADQNGGFFLTSKAEDSVCSFPLALLSHVSNNGTVAWENALYYEWPCLTQDLFSSHLGKVAIYCTITDSDGGWIIKTDTSGVEIWKVDSSYSIQATDVDRYERITAWDGWWSKVHCLDSASNELWSYVLPYTYTYQMITIISDKSGNRNLLYNFNDGTQTDTRGIGVLQLDSNGNFKWDTVINEQTTPDEDFLVDVKLDNENNIYVLSKDSPLNGCFLSKIDTNGNIVATARFTPNPSYRPNQLAIDTIHSLVYVAGRMTNSNFYAILKYNFQLVALDTMWFSRTLPDNCAINVNEYGYLFQLWTSDSSGSMELRLDMYNHLGQYIDGFTYWDSTRFIALIPHSIVFDSIGNIFAVCYAWDLSWNDETIVIKLSNPLSVSENSSSKREIVLFPNPATDFVTLLIPIHGDQTVVNFYNTAGQKSYSINITDNVQAIDLHDLDNGFYLVEAITENRERFISKLIINHQ